MKKFLSILMSIMLLTAMMTSSVFAVTLPDGGQQMNCGYSRAEGRSSGGSDGYANLICTITGENNILTKDTFTITTKSDVSSGLKAQNMVLAWYSTLADGGQQLETYETATSIPTSGFKTTGKAGNASAYKGTGGHQVTYNTRGSWICGTTYTF